MERSNVLLLVFEDLLDDVGVDLVEPQPFLLLRLVLVAEVMNALEEAVGSLEGQHQRGQQMLLVHQAHLL